MPIRCPNARQRDLDAASWIALGALAVSILVAIRGEMNLRGERRVRAREDERRDKEVRLLQAQVEGEAQDRLSERRAELICRQGERGGASQDVDEYTVAVLDGGKRRPMTFERGLRMRTRIR